MQEERRITIEKIDEKGVKITENTEVQINSLNAMIESINVRINELENQQRCETPFNTKYQTNQAFHKGHISEMSNYLQVQPDTSHLYLEQNLQSKIDQSLQPLKEEIE